MKKHLFKKSLCIISTLLTSFSITLPIANAETVTYNDPYSYAQYYLNDTGVSNVVQGKHTKTTKVKVAVFDGGFNLNQEDLRSVFASDSYRLIAGEDEAESRYYKTIYEDPFYRHGTGVSSVISMAIGNGIGGVGVAPNVEIYPISYYSNSIANYFYDGQENSNTVNDALKYCIENDIWIMNLSVSTIKMDTGLLDEYREKGGVIVVAAGNGGSDLDKLSNYPEKQAADYDIVIPVTGSRNGKAAYFCDYGKNLVALAAPCMDILVPYDYDDNTYYATGGTSEASPFVVGVFALLKGYFPDAPNLLIKQAIMETVDKDQTLENRCQAGGTVNAEKALIRLEELMGANITDDYYYIRNYNNDKYLTYDYAGKYNGVRVDNTPTKWKVELTKDKTYAILPADNMNASLDIINAQMVNNNTVWQYDYNEDKCQNWEIAKTKNGYQIKSALDPKYSLSYDARNNYETVINKTSTSSKQIWVFEKASEADYQEEILSGSFFIKNNMNDKYITSTGIYRGMEVSFADMCNDKASQWIIQYAGNGYYKIVSSNNNDMCFDVWNGLPYDGTLVWQCDYHNYDCQLWKITKNSNGTYTIASKLNPSLLLNVVQNDSNSNDYKLCISTVEAEQFSSSWTLENVDDMLDGRKFDTDNSLRRGTIEYIGNGKYLIRNSRGEVLTINDDSPKYEKKNMQKDCERSASYSNYSKNNESQIWKIRYINGKYYLIPFRFQCTAYTTGVVSTWLTSEIEGLSLVQ